MSKRSKTVSASKEHRIDTVCEAKRFFASEAEALEAADIKMLENMNLSIGIYQCASCRQWHLTRLDKLVD